MKNKRLLSLGMTIVLAVSACGCSQSTETMEKTAEGAAEENAGAVEIAQTAVNRSAGGDTEKEETVYVNADARGTVQNITVSSWLKNGSGAAELTDVTKLTDVVNVKGNETFTQDGDTYIWAANGNDIYYQGETSAALPVDVKVTYYLDEKEIRPEELAGKSGKVKIRFDYENHSTQKRVIAGEEIELYVPFLAASTVILDSDKFVNVEVENGKILSDGKNTIVAGVAMPGLYDSLDLLNLEGFEDVDIPEYVEITADVTDFELSMTATVLMPDVFSELNTDDMNGFDDLKDDIEELNDATYELIDGCIELDDGVQELKDNMPDLWDGAVELDDGAQELNDGAWELDDGAKELKDGADKLNDGAKDLREGAKELDQGVGTLQAGAGLLNNNMPKLTGGVNSLAEGLQSLQNPMMLGPDGKSGDAEHPYIKTSVTLLKNGVDQLVAGISGMGDSLEQAAAANQREMQETEQTIAGLAGQLAQKKKEAEEIQRQLTALAEQMGMLPSGSSMVQETGTEEAPDSAENSFEEETVDEHALQSEESLAASDNRKESAAESEERKDSSAAPDNGTDSSAAPAGTEDRKEPSTVPEGMEKPTTDTEGREEPSAAPEGTEEPADTENQKEPSAVPEDTKETGAASENQDAPAAAPDSLEESSAASQDVKEQTAAPENPSDVPDGAEEISASAENTSEEETAVPEETVKEEPVVVQDKASEEDCAEESEEAGTEELSEFAKVYLESLGRSAGMASVNMVQTANAGQGTGGVDLSDPAAVAAVMEGYSRALELQTRLSEKLNEIVTLQTQLQQVSAKYAGLVGANEALGQIAGQLSEGADAEQLAQLTEGMGALETSIGQIYDGVAQINSQMGTLTGGAAELSQGIGALKNGTDTLKAGTEKLYQGGIDLREGTKELYSGTEELKDGTEELKDGTRELKDGTEELKDGVVDLVDGVDELKDGTTELLDGVHEYNDDGIQKLYDTVNVDLQNLLDRVDAIADLSGNYQSFSGKSDAIEGSVKFIIETEAIELDEE